MRFAVQRWKAASGRNADTGGSPTARVAPGARPRGGWLRLPSKAQRLSLSPDSWGAVADETATSMRPPPVRTRTPLGAESSSEVYPAGAFSIAALGVRRLRICVGPTPTPCQWSALSCASSMACDLGVPQLRRNLSLISRTRATIPGPQRDLQRRWRPCRFLP